jgi:hypothetical protein
LPVNRIGEYDMGVMKTLTEIKGVLQTEKPYLADKYGVT